MMWLVWILVVVLLVLLIIGAVRFLRRGDGSRRGTKITRRSSEEHESS